MHFALIVFISPPIRWAYYKAKSFKEASCHSGLDPKSDSAYALAKDSRRNDELIEAKRQIDEMVPLLLDHMRPLADGLEGVQYRNILHITAPAGRDFELHIQALITAEEGLEIGIWDTAGGAAVFCSCVGWRKTMSEEFFISAHEALRRFIARLSEEYEILTESCRRLLVILEPSLA